MTFLTPLLTAGAALIAIPIVLHLVMRRKPQQLMFPALRFVMKRRSVNQTKLKLRHLILLLLRCAGIALLAFALARPVLQGSGLEGSGGSSAAALVIDNSPRMAYRSENQTRLAAAKNLADWLLGRLPADGQVVVADTGSTSPGRLLDREGARLRANRVRAASRDRGLAATTRSALAALAQAGAQRQEVFLFTDRSRGALDSAALESLAQSLEEHPKATLYIADVGVDNPVNVGIPRLELSASTLAVGQTLGLEATLASVGKQPDKPVTVELWIDGQSDSQSRPEKRGEQLVTIDSPQQQVEFSVASLTEGVHQGYVRVVGGDPLPADDTQYFTVSVEPPRRVLLLAAPPADPVFVREALTAAGPAQAYEVDVDAFSGKWPSKLQDYRAALLLDPPPLTSGSWRTLANYVSRGGSLAIALGRNSELARLNSADAQQLLPGEFRWKSRDETYLRPRSYSHPAIAPLADFAESIPWPQFPVFEYWSLGELSPEAVVVAGYANGEPAIVERRLDRGVALTVTTPLSDPSSGPSNGQPWNLLPTGVDPWPFLALVDSMGSYLCGAADTRRVYRPGETAIVPLGDAAGATSYVLRLPGGDSIRQTLPAAQSEAAIGMTEDPGNYRLQAGGGDERLDAGFSVSAPAEVGQLQRVTDEQIAAALPEGRYRLAAGEADLAEQVDIGRVGRELYPWLIMLAVIALAAEHFVANRFYDDPVDQ
ncbi:hypothetical protein Pla123a_05980 [Posidoniimonas polymericola]|uniref:Aerotolerance regulator N-terminal domain-containing protein n=1 Tax=Posidoniimonas polymericola TaxID=2528002 RepID=A0A5C5ZG02_9BACT|nr:BatA domain-containing protein [Posidoniimonas polymericola]TWT85791.1 hypothetical protein Pla123a_05980 [Posidoniimonas polymericola]